MIDTLKNIFKEKHKKEMLAHFYIFTSNSIYIKDKTLFLQEWTRNLILEMTNLKNIDHPDVLWITNKGQDTNYSVQEFKDTGFFEFLSLKHFKLNWKFIIIENGHKLTDHILNMLLKSLEAPSDKTTIILLHPTSEKLLQTVESRAIKVNINPQKRKNQSIENINDLDNLTISKKIKEKLHDFYENKISSVELLENFKGKKEDQAIFFEFILAQEALNLNTSYKHKKDFLNNVIHFEKSKVFNNSYLERFLSLLKG